MKNTALVILLIATLGLGTAWLLQSNQTKTATAKLAAAQAELAAQSDLAAAAEAEARRLRERLETAQMESARNAGQAAQLAQALTNRVEEFIATQPDEISDAPPTNPLADMLRSPEMREMIKGQQKTVLGGMVDQNYAAFFKAMNLTPEQSADLKDLILNKMLSDAEMGMDLMSGDLTDAQRAEIASKAKENKAALDEAIRALLGDENFASYQDYEKSVPDRMAINQLKTQFGEGLALNAEQESLLIAAMGQERQAFKFTTDFNNQTDFSGDFMSRFTEENLDVFLQEQQRLNENYLKRAQPILSTEQLAAYQKALTAQQEMAKMGMRMAVQMFGPKKE
jgi:hypothetical protein